jgi:D-3-phosphoglycerate dehydrogenase
MLLVGDTLYPPDQMVSRFAPIFRDHDVEMAAVHWNPQDTMEDFARRVSNVEKNGPRAEAPPAEIGGHLEEAEILVVNFGVVPEGVIRAGRKLRLIGVLRSGCENVDLEAATESGVVVVNAPGRNADAVADYTIGLMLAENRNIARSNAALLNGAWKKKFPNAAHTVDLRGRTVGIVGFGEVGRRVARRLQGFDVRTLVYDPFVPRDDVERAGCTPVDLPDLLRASDFVTVHARLSAETERMIGRKELEMMRPGAYLVNTARAGLVDYDVLYQFLKENRIAGAALDVFPREPLGPDSPWLALPNVTLTPHRAGATVDSETNAFTIMGDEVARYFAGQRLTHVMNPSVLSRKEG